MVDATLAILALGFLGVGVACGVGFLTRVDRMTVMGWSITAASGSIVAGLACWFATGSTLATALVGPTFGYFAIAIASALRN